MHLKKDHQKGCTSIRQTKKHMGLIEKHSTNLFSALKLQAVF